MAWNAFLIWILSILFKKIGDCAHRQLLSWMMRKVPICCKSLLPRSVNQKAGGPWLARISLIRISLARIFKYRPFLGLHILRISLARSFTKELVYNFTSTDLACMSFSLAQNSCKPRTPWSYKSEDDWPLRGPDYENARILSQWNCLEQDFIAKW